MNKLNNIKKLSLNKFDVLAFAYFCLVINQGVYIETISIGRFTLLEIFPLFFLLIIGVQNFFLNFHKVIKYIYIYLISLFIFSCIASFYQESVSVILYTLIFIVLVIIFLNFSGDTDIADEDIFKFFKYILIINFFILLACLIFGDSKYLKIDEFYRFRGIFGNSNQLGRFCSISIILCSFAMFENYLKLGKGFNFICVINLILSTILLLFSNSRLSLLVVLVGLFFYLLLNFQKIKSLIYQFYKLNFLTKIYLFFFIIFALLFFFLSTKDALIALSNKFLTSEMLEVRGGLSAYRLPYILYSLDFLNFFGYQSFKEETSICSEVLDHYVKSKQFIKCDVHNTYLNIWLKYGFYFAFFLFYGLIISLIFSISYNDKKPKFIFISKFVSVITVSLFVYYLFETGLLHIFFVLDLIFLSYLLKNKYAIAFTKNEN